MIDSQYEDLLMEILTTGYDRPNRTGVGTRGLFGHQLRYDLSEGFPLITTKKIHLKSVICELLWFLSGSTNVTVLQDQGVRIWNDWVADENGDLGPIYGAQWRNWNPSVNDALQGIDQISELIEGLRKDPYGRRHLVTAWNPTDIPAMALPACHYAFQCHVHEGRLDLMVQQRSCDMFLGVPFNIASYALLTHMLAQQTGLEPGELIWMGGDVHIYKNHFDQVREQISRNPYPFSTLILEKAPSIFEYRFDDVTVVDYSHHPAIPAPVAV